MSIHCFNFLISIIGIIFSYIILGKEFPELCLLIAIIYTSISVTSFHLCKYEIRTFIKNIIFSIDFIRKKYYNHIIMELPKGNLSIDKESIEFLMVHDYLLEEFLSTLNYFLTKIKEFGFLDIRYEEKNLYNCEGILIKVHVLKKELEEEILIEILKALEKMKFPRNLVLRLG